MIPLLALVLLIESASADQVAEIIDSSREMTSVQKSNRAFCNAIAEFPRKGYSWENRGFKSPCAGYQFDPVASSPSRPLSKSERKRRLQRAEVLRPLAIKSCCRGEKECGKAMNDVDIRLCDDRVKDCETRAGWHTVQSDKVRQIGFNLSNWGLNQKKFPRTFRAQLERHMGAIAPAESENPEAAQIISGSILLSGFDLPQINMDDVVLHEFGHACSTIRRQLFVYRTNSESAFHSLMRSYYPFNIDRCAKTKHTEETYKRLSDQWPSGPAVWTCLSRVTKSVSKWVAKHSKRDKAIDPVCQASYLEESFANLNAIYSGAVDSANDAKDFCGGSGDDAHLAQSLVIECLLQNSKEFRDRARRNMKCNEK